MSVHVFGIRHHGPGCAQSLRAALETLAPDAVLVEGPPDADALLPLVADEGLVPPVALLVHVLDQPQTAVFYPFAEFSPEWQALRYATTRGVPVRFMDLPCAITLAPRARSEEERASAGSPAGQAPEGSEPVDAERDTELDLDPELRDDPLGVLAEAAGFSDREQWWDVQVEQRRDPTGLFEAILTAMSAVREQHERDPLRERQREAHMRSVIRATQKQGATRIAVVCGAWHAPVLAELGPAKPDLELLKGLPKVKVASTWIPWTYSRLSRHSGYGAGVESPGWYAHVWRYGDRAATTWATLAARLLRGEDLDASSASAIETVRLAQSLSAVRDLPLPGLVELRHAIEAVLCQGQPSRLELVRQKLEVGEALGAVPDHAGQVPIWRDFERETKRLRLKLSADPKLLELDLRKDLDRERSNLLYRLRILGVEWGKLQPGAQGAGTFREHWQLRWSPDLSVELMAGNLHGNTLHAAASSALRERAGHADLSEVTRLVELALTAGLAEPLSALLGELDTRAASSSDVVQQMNALSPLARMVRYGDVRGTPVAQVFAVVKALFERIVVGLVPACSQLDDEAARTVLQALNHAHAACSLLDDAELRADWLDAIAALQRAPAAHPRLRGRATRLRLEQRSLEPDELSRQARLELSPSVPPAESAQWLEGLIEGEGLLLVHQEELLEVVDGWLRELANDVFVSELPLLRRAFSGLSAPERRAVAARVKHAGRSARRMARPATEEHFDPDRLARVLPGLAQLLGVAHE